MRPRLPTLDGARLTGAELLLRAALAPEAFSDCWEQWQRHANVHGCDSESARLLPLVYGQRAVLFDGPDGSGWMEVAADAYRRTWARNELIMRSARDAGALLVGAGIDVMPVKGLALLDRFYGDRGLRPMLDADVLVPRQQFLDAVRLLQAVGWELTEPLPPDGLASRGVGMADQSGRQLDLHRNLFLTPLEDRDEDRRWERSVASDLLGVPVRAADASDLLLHVIDHGTHRFGAGRSARWVADTVVLVRSGELDWELLVEVAKLEGLAAATVGALEYVQSLVGVAVDGAALAALHAAPTTWLSRWAFESRPPAEVTSSPPFPGPVGYSLLWMVGHRGVRRGVRETRRSIHDHFGSTPAWMGGLVHRYRERRAVAAASPGAGDAAICHALGIEPKR